MVEFSIPVDTLVSRTPAASWAAIAIGFSQPAFAIELSGPLHGEFENANAIAKRAAARSDDAQRGVGR